MKAYLVEEAYEVCEAIDRGSPAELCDELGDLLFQVVFHAHLGEEQGHFDLDDIENAISDKLERRHPYVFGGEAPVDGADAARTWEALKAVERADKGVLHGLPRALPALHKARRLTDKAAAVGFEWPDSSGAWNKFDEELAELREAITQGSAEAISAELGDVLFTLVNIARWLRVDPEEALQQANRRFTRRFSHVEEGLRKQGVPFGSASLEQMDALWDEAKKRGL